MEGLGQGHRGAQGQDRGIGTWSIGTGTQMTGMWEEQDRDTGDRESDRGTWTRTEGDQDQDKDVGDWD